MHFITDEFLINVYYKAVNLNLNDDFINLLRDEIRHRHIELEPSSSS